MITRLFIRNLVLIDQVTIQFGKGLNILSGETGSGKSAILSALNLIVGERADLTCVRKGCEKAIVEAVFDIDSNPEVSILLHEMGILHDPGDELIICREIHVKGKGRIFVNNQRSSATLLRQLGELLLGIVGQHANQKLFSLDYHRFVIDLYGDLLPKIQLFKKGWEEERALQNEIEELKDSEAARIREIERCRAEEEEITEANVQDGEDEALFAEYTRLLHTEEITKLCHEIHHALDDTILPELVHLKRHIEQLLSLDTELEEVGKTFQGTVAELQEISFSIEKARGRREADPNRIEEVNERLAKVTRMKKKYGEITPYLVQLKQRLNELENVDSKIEELDKRWRQREQDNNVLAQTLTKLRKKSALSLQESMKCQLQQLNMPNASFSISLTPSKRSGTGDDGVEFFLSPNVGEHAVSVKECASGGELSRVMLAIQTLIGGKEQTPTILFDEIDANIGGETAVVVGEKLQEIATKHQVLCVTHFPQVAKQGDHHFRIRKEETEGRTVTLVDSLIGSDREDEINRMLGLTVSLKQ